MPVTNKKIRCITPQRGSREHPAENVPIQEGEQAHTNEVEQTQVYSPRLQKGTPTWVQPVALASGMPGDRVSVAPTPTEGRGYSQPEVHYTSQTSTLQVARTVSLGAQTGPGVSRMVLVPSGGHEYQTYPQGQHTLLVQTIGPLQPSQPTQFAQPMHLVQPMFQTDTLQILPVQSMQPGQPMLMQGYNMPVVQQGSILQPQQAVYSTERNEIQGFGMFREDSVQVEPGMSPGLQATEQQRFT